ncbi:helix-turn-helix domain-containing protein [Natribacillus halophilus]|uniref:DNA-binding transcriptional regulator, XRE family n=1 Tax=Natribacillus halophilus TaxID=549003 RepID=A0A1G8KIC9_9BACI|nr:helix-turn-helix transcriptional regulator [Natribacillus halophilus]SDI43154.1 DNA-binding transcriptional regulator, XRE family [Natribacillus halophilus]
MGFIYSNLKVLMAERDLNIQKIKEETTLSRTTISYLVNNYGEGVHYETLKQLCQLLRCQPGDIFTYYDFEVSFDVRGRKKDWSEFHEPQEMEEEEDEERIDVEVIDTELDIQVDTSYKGKPDQFQMTVFPTVTLTTKGKEKILEKLTIGADHGLPFEEAYPLAVQRYLLDQLEKFLIQWVSEKSLDVPLHKSLQNKL